MTDTLAVGSITQLTETGTLTRFAPLTRDEVDMAQFARLEARPIMPAPERDMAITQEELGA